MEPTIFWKKGQQAKLAKEANIHLSHLSVILSRIRGVSPKRAVLLEEASIKVLGEKIPKEEWVFNRTSNHPAFKNVG